MTTASNSTLVKDNRFCEICGAHFWHPWSRKTCSRTCRSKLSAKSKIGSLNPQWKANNDIHIVTLHQWVHRNYPMKKLCEECNLVPPLDAANKSGKYLRDESDWRWLCRRCHMKSDGRMKNLIARNIPPKKSS